MRKKSESQLPMEMIAGCILVGRKQKVMLDEDLAGLYGVEHRRHHNSGILNIAALAVSTPGPSGLCQSCGQESSSEDVSETSRRLTFVD